MTDRPSTSGPFTVWGETKTLAQWAEDQRCQVSRETLRGRLKLGWSMQKALTTPARHYTAHHLVGSADQERTLRAWSLQSDCAVSYSTLHARVVYRGWPLELARMTPAGEIPPGLHELLEG